jgi:hypothetical protein
VKRRFFENCQIAYDSHVATPNATAEAATADGCQAAATADCAKALGQELASEDKKKGEVTQNEMISFRQACEAACQEEINARVVVLVVEGTQVETHASVTSTRLYKNLTEAATVMGFNDVKTRNCVASSRGKASRTVSLRWTRMISTATSSPSCR